MTNLEMLNIKLQRMLGISSGKANRVIQVVFDNLQKIAAEYEEKENNSNAQ